MPLLQTSGNVTADGYGGGAAAVPNYIEDVFSTYLYTGNGSTQTITNGIDLSTKGGLVWTKQRSTAANHALIDTARGRASVLYSNLTDFAATSSAGSDISSFGTTGYSLGANNAAVINSSAETYASWTFRKQPKFFTCLTYSGNSTNRTITHDLGSVPGCILIKKINGAAAWQVYHRSLANTEYLVLNTTAAKATGATRWNSTTATSTTFSLGTDTTVNDVGDTYVAYLFAHNAGGFGLTGTDNVISCGSITAAGAGSINLGYEPQWILVKCSTAAAPWYLIDNMRGWVADVASNSRFVSPNTSGAETDITGFSPTATGFNYDLGSGQTYIYIAIRRGPMKVPTSGTSVFLPYTAAVATGGVNVSTGFVADTTFSRENRAAAGSSTYVSDRLRGSTASYQGTLITRLTAAESTAASGGYYDYSYNTSMYDKFAANNSFAAGNFVDWIFKRAPNFFDVVCYTGTGGGANAYLDVSHNLGVTPEMIIVKQRNAVNATAPYDWPVYQKDITTNGVGVAWMVGNAAKTTDYLWRRGASGQKIDASTFSLNGNYLMSNQSGGTYVAYLFATCAGVSKVGSYTGNGSSQTINCGFTSGARFVLIKRTDSTGDWYVYDTARGMTTLTDPYLLMNSSAAESATLGSVTTVSTGFAVNASILAAINTNAASYIFLAIA